MTAINARIPRSEITAPIINRSLSRSLYRTAHWLAASMLLRAYVAPVLAPASEQQPNSASNFYSRRWASWQANCR
jgi:hypothetical protein